MKKTYIQPVCNMTYVELQKMIASTTPTTPDNIGQRGGNSLGDSYDASRGSFWDDDDE